MVSEIEGLMFSRWLKLLQEGDVNRVKRSAQELSQSQTWQEVREKSTRVAEFCQDGDIQAARSYLSSIIDHKGQSR